MEVLLSAVTDRPPYFFAKNPQCLSFPLTLCSNASLYGFNLELEACLFLEKIHDFLILFADAPIPTKWACRCKRSGGARNSSVKGRECAFCQDCAPARDLPVAGDAFSLPGTRSIAISERRTEISQPRPVQQGL